MLLRRYGCVRERRWRIVLTDALRKCSIPPFWMVFSKTFSELVRGVGTRDYISNICGSHPACLYPRWVDCNLRYGKRSALSDL